MPALRIRVALLLKNRSFSLPPSSPQILASGSDYVKPCLRVQLDTVACRSFVRLLIRPGTYYATTWSIYIGQRHHIVILSLPDRDADNEQVGSNWGA